MRQKTKLFIFFAVFSIFIFVSAVVVPGILISEKQKKSAKVYTCTPKVTSYEYNDRNIVIRQAIEIMNPLLAQQIPELNQDVCHVMEYDDFYIFISCIENEVSVKIIYKEWRK